MIPPIDMHTSTMLYRTLQDNRMSHSIWLHAAERIIYILDRDYDISTKQDQIIDYISHTPIRIMVEFTSLPPSRISEYLSTNSLSTVDDCLLEYDFAFHTHFLAILNQLRVIVGLNSWYDANDPTIVCAEEFMNAMFRLEQGAGFAPGEYDRLYENISRNTRFDDDDDEDSDHDPNEQSNESDEEEHPDEGHVVIYVNGDPVRVINGRYMRTLTYDSELGRTGDVIPYNDLINYPTDEDTDDEEEDTDDDEEED